MNAKTFAESKPNTKSSKYPYIPYTVPLPPATVTVANGALSAPLMVMQFDIPSCGLKIKTSYNT